MTRVAMPKTVEGLRSLKTTIASLKKGLIKKNIDMFESHAELATSELGIVYGQRILVWMRALLAIAGAKNAESKAKRVSKASIAGSKVENLFNKKIEKIDIRIAHLKEKKTEESPKKVKKSPKKSPKKSKKAPKKVKKSPKKSPKKSKKPKPSSSMWGGNDFDFM